MRLQNSRMQKNASVWSPACQASAHVCAAGVFFFLKGALLSVPSIASPEFDSFWQMGRVVHAVIPHWSGHFLHFFGVCGFQGADKDPENLALAASLLRAVFCEARILGHGQLVLTGRILMCILITYFVLPNTCVKVGGLTWKRLSPWRLDWQPAVTCRTKEDFEGGARRDFLVVSPLAFAAVKIAGWSHPDGFSLVLP